MDDAWTSTMRIVLKRGYLQALDLTDLAIPKGRKVGGVQEVGGWKANTATAAIV